MSDRPISEEMGNYGGKGARRKTFLFAFGALFTILFRGGIHLQQRAPEGGPSPLSLFRFGESRRHVLGTDRKRETQNTSG